MSTANKNNSSELLSEKLISKTDTSKIIITGDWNTTLNKIDKHGGLPWKETTYRNSIIDLMEELDLLDIYRELHVNTKTFTYETKNLKIKSRIDFFLVSRAVSVNVKRAEIRCSVAPDHKSIFLGIELKSDLKRGLGTWKFNNTLLDDKNYVDLIRFLYPQILEKYKDVENKQLLWELIKMEIRSKTLSYSKSKRCELRKREVAIQNELEELDFKICNSANMDLDSQILDKYESAKKGLKNLHDLRGNEAIFRSKPK